MYYNFEPSKKEKFLYYCFYGLYIIQLPFAMLFMIQYYKSLIKFLFRLKETDFVFTSTGNIIFGLFGFFIWIPLSAYILYLVFSFVFNMKSTFEYYDEKYKENYPHRGGRYNISFGTLKRDKIACVIIEIAAAILFLFSIFYNIRVTDQGIFHKKFFSFRTEKIEWNDINKLELDLEIRNTKKETDLIPHFYIYYSDNKLDIWNGFGMGSPSPEEIMKFTDSVRLNNQNVTVNTNFNLDGKTMKMLRKYKNGEQDIQTVYNYLRNY